MLRIYLNFKSLLSLLVTLNFENFTLPLSFGFIVENDEKSKSPFGR